MDNKKRSVLSLILFIVVVSINYLTAMGSISGISTQKEVSKAYNTTITPAGFAFSIWGVIYVLLFLTILYMIRISFGNKREAKIVEEISAPLYGLFVFNILWNIVFGMAYIELSVILILGYWITLIYICLDIKNSKVKLNPLFLISFGIHAGWITIASIVNFYAYLVKINWKGFQSEKDFWTLVGIIAIVIIVFILQIIIKNGFLPLATAWAIFGIYSRTDVSYNKFKFIPVILLLGIILLIISSITTFYKNEH